MGDFRKKLREKEEALLAVQESQYRKYQNKINKKQNQNIEPNYTITNKNHDFNGTEDYPELPKTEPLINYAETEVKEEKIESNGKKLKEEERKEEKMESENEEKERKQYLLSDYIIGELNTNTAISEETKFKKSKKGKKQKKIILFSNSLNHY